jgi:predicted MFS family arabinose efflux permease
LKGFKIAYLYALAGFSLLLLNGWRMVLSVFYSPLMRVFGLTAVTPVAAASAVWGLASMLASPIAGRMYDRKGPAPALLAASILQAISGLAVWLMRFYPWGSAQWLWYAAAAANGAIASLLMMSVSPMVIALFPSKAGYALAFTQAGNYLSFLVWSPIAYALLASLDPFSVYAAFTAVSLATTAACAAAYRKVRPEASGRTSRKSSLGFPRMFLLLLILVFEIAASSTIIVSFAAPIFEEICPQWAPAAMAAAGLAQVAGAVAWGYLLERGDVLKLIPATYALETASALLSAALFGTDAALAAALLLLRFAAFAGEPLVHTMVVPKLFGKDAVGSLLGIQMSVVMLSSVLAPLAGAIARDAAGSYRASVLLSAFLSLAATLNALPVVRSAAKAPHEPTSDRREAPC